MIGYRVIDLFDGNVKKCTREQAESCKDCEDFFVITPEGKWWTGEDEIEPEDQTDSEEE